MSADQETRRTRPAPLAHVESGQGPVLVLLHAFPVHGALWDAQRLALAGRGWRVVVPDLRGFGRSPLAGPPAEGPPDTGAPQPGAPPSLDASAGDVLALLDRLGVDRFVLGGLSMGGYTAMAVLRAAPGRVAGLVLADTKASADVGAARADRERVAATVLAEGSPRVLLDEALPRLLGPTTLARRPEVVATVRGWVAQARPEAVAWAQRAMAARPDSLDVLAGAGVPALVLRGSEDALSSPADTAAMAGALGCTPVEVPAAGHLAAVEAPAAVAAAVGDFLAGLR